jgi:putative drug exporter of the RND superfamily
MRLNPESIARASSRHPWRTVGVWLVIFVLAGASSSALLGSALTTDIDFTNTPEAKEAQQILEQRRLEQDLVTENWVIAGSGEGAVEDPAFVEDVNSVLQDLNALGKDVVTYAPPAFPLPAEVAQDPETAPMGPIPSEDGRAVLFTVVMAGDIDDAAEHVDQLETIREEASTGGNKAYILGDATSTEDFKTISEEDLRFGESIGIVAAIIVLIVVFGALIAGVTPIIMAVFAISVTLGIVAVIGQLWKFTFFAPNLISMMGLAVGIDYSLFIVSRYREERRKGGDKLRSIGRSGATANRAVFFSGLTVVIALSGMLLVPTTIFRGLAGGAIIVVLVSVAASMTLLPAVLSLLGTPATRVGADWLDWPWMSRTANALALLGMIVVAGAVATIASAVGAPGGLVGLAGFLGFVAAAVGLTRWLRRESSWLSRRIRHEQIEQGRPGGFWDRASRAVMARPVISLVLSASLLIVLSLPFWLQPHPDDDGRGIKQGLAGVTTLPDDIQTKQAFLALVRYFPKSGANSTAQVVILGSPTDPQVQQGIETLTDEIGDDPRLGTPAEPRASEDGTVTVLDIPLAGDATDAQSEAAVLAIRELRGTYIPEAFGDSGVRVLVGGDTAFITDFFDVSSDYTPLIIVVVLSLSFILLTVVFRSLVVPAKAIVMNLLSVGAAYGLIVLVFQKGGPAIGKTIADAFGFQQTDAIEAWLPLFLFSILFGLSMDYHVFLLTRIREEYDKTRDNAEAVTYGLRTTGGIITGAAIIMVAVFAGFAAGRLTALEEMGFGLAVAVLIDATIVRSILVPSAMKLLGDRNWYLPRWLQWLPDLDVEGHVEAQKPVVVPEVQRVGARDDA